MTAGDPGQTRARWARRLGLIVAVAGLIADQAHKFWMLNITNIAETGPIPVTSFLTLVLTWNKGVSYGLFSQDSSLGQWLLIAIAVLATVFLAIWLSRTDRYVPAISLGLVIAGALGNAIDRVNHGAVADFFHFHVGGFSWYVFNVADIWIVAGVAGLLYDSILGRPNDAANDGQKRIG